MMNFYCSEKHDKTNWFNSDWETKQNTRKLKQGIVQPLSKTNESKEERAAQGAEVACLKVARIFNPLHVLGYPISVADIDSLKFLSLRLTEHPLIRPHLKA
jgi:hypothetical protein